MSQGEPECKGLSSTIGATLKVTLLASEWTSSAGGLSTLNRELAIQLSQHPQVEVSLLVPEGACKDEDKREAQSYSITVVDAKKLPGYDDPLDWLGFPPKDIRVDVVVGHGVKLGRQGHVIREFAQFDNCKWVQVVHTAPEDLSRFKSYSKPISKGEKKHQAEVELCKLADLVVPIGPELKEAYSAYLRRCKTDQDVFAVTPGIFHREFGDLKQAPNENAKFKVLLCGRGDDEDFELKGYNLAAKTFTHHRLKNKPYHLLFVGAPDEKQDEVREKLLQCGILEDQLFVREFVKSREKMKDLLCEVDLAIMPSKSEGFGLVALEALSAGLPILVGRRSGFAKALESIPSGKSCIVDSDDPAEWAEAIEGVRHRHGMWIDKMKKLRASYDEKYSWKEQCEDLVANMWRIVHGHSSSIGEEPQPAADLPEAVCKSHSSQQSQPCIERSISQPNFANARTSSSKEVNRNKKKSRSISESPFYQGPSDVSVKSQNAEVLFEQQLVVDTRDEALGSSSKPVLEEEKITSGRNEEGASSSSNDSYPAGRNQSTPGSIPDTGNQDSAVTVHLKITTQDLDYQQQEIFDDLMQHMLLAMEPDTLCTAEGLGSLTEYLKESYNLLLKRFTNDGLEMVVQCANVESFERLLNDYHSGHLSEVAEKCLVTDDIKTILHLETVRLKIVIKEEENLDMLGVASSIGSGSPFKQLDPDQGGSARWTDIGVPCEGSSPSKQTEPDQRTDARWTDTGLPREGSSPSKQTEPDQRTDARWTDTGVPREGSSPSKQTEPGQRSDTRWTDTGVPREGSSPSKQTEPGQKSDTRWTDTGVPREGNSPSKQTAPGQRSDTRWTDTGVPCERSSPSKQTAPGQRSDTRWTDTGVTRKTGSRGPSKETAPDQGVKSRWTDTGKAIKTGSPSKETKLQRGEDARRPDTRSQIQKGVKDVNWMNRAEKAKASRSALHHASSRGQHGTVKLLLDSGEDVDQRDQFSLTPLHLACWYGQESVVRLLVEHGANVNAVDRFQRTPLQKAERHNHQSIVHLLRRNDARPSYQQPLSLKSLSRKAFLQMDQRSGFNVLQAAVFEGDYSIVFKAVVLLDNFVEQMNSVSTRDGAYIFPGKTAVDILSNLDTKRPGHYDINILYREEVKKVNTLTELHWCAIKGEAEKAVEVVINDGVDVDIPALCNRTPLLQASLSSSSMLIKTLIDLGADVNAQRTDDKVAPLLLAVDWNNYMAVKLLLEHGADVNMQTSKKQSPLRDAVAFNHDNLVKMLLGNKADTNNQDGDGDTPLHFSVRKGNSKISQVLIEAGCNINLRNKRHQTPLYIAVKNKHEQLTRLLLDCNADISMGYKQNSDERIYLVRGKDRGKLAWHYVLVERHLLGLFLKRTNGGSLDVADFGTVLKSGWGQDPPKNTIDQILKDHDNILKEIPGETLLHVASRNNDAGMIDLLVKYGAWDVNARDADGFTPLHIAAIHGNLQVVKKLVDLEAHVSEAIAVVDMAHLNEETEIEEYLKSKIGSSERTGREEVGRDVARTNPFAEAGSGMLRFIRSNLNIGTAVLDAVVAAVVDLRSS